MMKPYEATDIISGNKDTWREDMIADALGEYLWDLLDETGDCAVTIVRQGDETCVHLGDKLLYRIRRKA